MGTWEFLGDSHGGGSGIAKGIFCNCWATGCASIALSPTNPPSFRQAKGQSPPGACLGYVFGTFAVRKKLLWPLPLTAAPQNKYLPEERRAGWAQLGTYIVDTLAPLIAVQQAVWWQFKFLFSFIFYCKIFPFIRMTQKALCLWDSLFKDYFLYKPQCHSVLYALRLPLLSYSPLILPALPSP